MSGTAVNPLNLAFAADSAGAAFAWPQPRLTPPVADTGIALLTLGTSGISVQNDLEFVFFGRGAAAGTFSAYLVGWNLCTVNTVATWTPRMLAQLTCTLGAGTAIANSIFPGGVLDLFCHQLAIVIGNQNVDVAIVSPGSNITASAIVDAKGCPYCTLMMTLGSATAANALWRGL